VPRFVELARSRFPDISVRVAELDELGVPDRSVTGILSWYSIIHTDPEDVPHVLGEFARCLCDGGSLLLGMFDGTQEATESRIDPGRRPHAAIVARRASGDR
jgi:ubiquinone/menaquinone biosynthesis C-methylase UbiE